MSNRWLVLAGLLAHLTGPAIAGAQIGSYIEGARVETQMFGVRAEASRFVYVVDRSGSTEDPPGHDVLSAAKAELLASLKDLDSGQQFQIIFYNDAPRALRRDDGGNKLLFATAENKEAARKFIQSIRSDGGTDHETALTAAIRMQPDVIFFLTDGDRPKLTAGQLDHLQRMANGIRIYAIQFGVTPQGPVADFMRELAQQNDGQYKYVDVTTWKAR